MSTWICREEDDGCMGDGEDFRDGGSRARCADEKVFLARLRLCQVKYVAGSEYACPPAVPSSSLSCLVQPTHVGECLQ